jgi:hypothetical protein
MLVVNGVSECDKAGSIGVLAFRTQYGRALMIVNCFTTAQIYEGKFGYARDYHATAAVAAVQAIVIAIEQAETVESKNVRDAIAKLDFEKFIRPCSVRRQWTDHHAANCN